jgi:hypothetical protein
MTVLTVPWKCREIPVFDDSIELIVKFAESGTCGLHLVTVGSDMETSDSTS